MKNWCHSKPSILNQGRVVRLDPEAPDGEDPDKFKLMLDAKDPYLPRFKPISEDSYIKCSIPSLKIPSWKLSYCYDDKIYVNPDIIVNMEEEEANRANPNVSYSIIHLRNLVWPGAHVIRLKGQIHYYYFGWGMKYSDDIMEDKFVFQSFPKIEEENEDLPIGAEPNFPPLVEENNPENNPEDQ